jgi:hypothetical protein
MTGLSFAVVYQMSGEEREQIQADFAEAERRLAKKGERSEATRAARDRRYNTSERGRARHRRYNESEKGKARAERYDSSANGRAVRYSYEFLDRRFVTRRHRYADLNAKLGREAELPDYRSKTLTWRWATAVRVERDLAKQEAKSEDVRFRASVIGLA